MRYLRYIIFAVLVIGLPPLGLKLDGMRLGPYLEFPPRSSYVAHAGFLWPVFIGMAAVIAVFVGVLVLSLGVTWLRNRRAPAPGERRAFPRWGWWGLAALAVFWVIAWTRLPGLGWLQPHTFTPLWLACIVVVNAWTFRRTGRSLLTHRPRYLAALFVGSGAFWWFFEYLNRFVQNWYYREALAYSRLGYLVAASLAFSTVLPAVLSVHELVLSYGWFNSGYGAGWRLRLPWPRLRAVLVLLTGCVFLLAVGVYPNLLYPMLWVAPILVLTGLETLGGERHLFSMVGEGDWRPLMGTMVAALACGFLWEMWNSRSLAKWFYEIPFVHRYQLFEMPILGYAGYLPFGWECGLAGGIIERHLART